VLFGQAEGFFAENPDWSNQCVALARKIATKQRIRMDREFRRRFCRKCGSFLVPGVNQRIRVQRGRVSATCLVCGTVARYRTGRRYERRARA